MIYSIRKEYINVAQKLLIRCIRMGKTKDKTYWNIPVPKPLDKAVEKALKVDAHVSKADFVRDAVRRMLEKMGLYPLLQNDEK